MLQDHKTLIRATCIYEIALLKNIFQPVKKFWNIDLNLQDAMELELVTQDASRDSIRLKTQEQKYEPAFLKV